jgi:glycerophosphoryl diester phosphodiesterase
MKKDWIRLPLSAPEEETSYPRICAHRGIPAAAPENTLPGFAYAIAMGADEIEFDVRTTADGALVVCHDPTIDRTTDRTGAVNALTLEEIRQADAGVKCSPAYAGTKIPLLEEVFFHFAKRTVMNIHVYASVDWNEPKPEEYDPVAFSEIVGLIRKYGCENHCYIAGDVDVLKTTMKLAPDLKRCCLGGVSDFTMVEKAIEYKCHKAQFTKGFVTPEMIEKAHDHGICCNIFWANEGEEARHFVEMGFDTILTDNYLVVAKALGRSLEQQ